MSCHVRLFLSTADAFAYNEFYTKKTKTDDDIPNPSKTKAPTKSTILKAAVLPSRLGSARHRLVTVNYVVRSELMYIPSAMRIGKV